MDNEKIFYPNSMFGMNLVTGPSFLGGILYGINNRSRPDAKYDPYAHYKLMSLTSALGFLKIISNSNFPISNSRPGQILISGILGGVLLSGTTFCMGTMLAKIPGGFPVPNEKEKKGVSFKLF
jgi:hypothetical protein